MIDRITAILRDIRPRRVGDELAYLHPLIEQALIAAGIGFKREAQVAPRCRLDFLTDGGVGIEIKKRRPPRQSLQRQVDRYLGCPGIAALVVVVERHVEVVASHGKPLQLISLNENWGVAVS